MDYAAIVSSMAGILTVIAFLPQVIKIWKTKSTKDISLGMFIIFCTGVFLWFIFGILIKSLPVIITNAVTFTLASIILVLKLKYK